MTTDEALVEFARRMEGVRFYPAEELARANTLEALELICRKPGEILWLASMIQNRVARWEGIPFLRALYGQRFGKPRDGIEVEPWELAEHPIDKWVEPKIFADARKERYAEQERPEGECGRCGGTGWVTVVRGGLSGAQRCTCWRVPALAAASRERKLLPMPTAEIDAGKAARDAAQAMIAKLADGRRIG